MITVITWIDTAGPILYEARRSEAHVERWSLMRLDVFAQRDPDSIPGEVLLRDVSLAEVQQHMLPVLEQLDPPEDG